MVLFWVFVLLKVDYHNEIVSLFDHPCRCNAAIVFQTGFFCGLFAMLLCSTSSGRSSCLPLASATARRSRYVLRKAGLTGIVLC